MKGGESAVAVKACCTVQGISFGVDDGNPYLVCRIDASSGLSARKQLYLMSSPSAPISTAIIGISTWAKQIAEANLNVTFDVLDTVRVTGMVDL